MELNLNEVAYQMLKKVEFYGLKPEADYRCEDFEKTKERILSNKLSDKDYYEIIHIYSQILMENV
ncbi:MAG: hypothetical protein ACRDDH_02975 [Cetobacterium sp.]|uniref:hypothetical protein n=1 Tax=Cetobacterium sp. TaxID=2071632 RepID=UPI003EE53075